MTISKMVTIVGSAYSFTTVSPVCSAIAYQYSKLLNRSGTAQDKVYTPGTQNSAVYTSLTFPVSTGPVSGVLASSQRLIGNFINDYPCEKNDRYSKCDDGAIKNSFDILNYQGILALKYLQFFSRN